MHRDDALLTNAAATPRRITGIAPAKPLRGAPAKRARALATSGQRVPIPQGASGPTWTSPAPPDYSGWGDSQDLALSLRKR
jgi:hypothetical protein